MLNISLKKSSVKIIVKAKVVVKHKFFWTIVLALILITQVTYLVFKDNIHQLASKVLHQNDPKTAQQANDQEQQVLDCAKKIDMSKNLADLSDKEVRDCLFVGCGNFFQ